MVEFTSKHNYKRIRPYNEDSRTFTFEQVMDVVALLRNNAYPNAEFGDDECSLWEAIKRELEIEF